MDQFWGARSVAFGFYLDRKAFERRNYAGIEQFESYNQRMKIKAEEGLIKVVGTLFGTVGIFCIIGHFMR